MNVENVQRLALQPLPWTDLHIRGPTDCRSHCVCLLSFFLAKKATLRENLRVLPIIGVFAFPVKDWMSNRGDGSVRGSKTLLLNLMG